MARDILELDDAEFSARIEAVKRRMPQAPGAGLQPYVDESPNTAPVDYLPQFYVDRMAAHAASELHDEDKWRPGEGSGPFLWPLAIVLVVSLASFVAWVTR